MIKSKKCCVRLNKALTPEYHVAKRVGPFLPPISIDRIQKVFFFKSSCETERSTINFPMTMISMHFESENQRIPLIPN